MHSIEECISKAYLLPEERIKRAQEIINDIGYYKSTGRPPIDPKRVVQAIYYLARTGIQWNALPLCFGVSSTIHAAFQRLNDLGFFDNFWIEGLEKYDEEIGLKLDKCIGDCSHTKSPLGGDSVGASPVDRKKQGTKRSIVTDADGIMLGCVIAPGNRNDAKLLHATLSSIPSQFRSDGSHKIWLDAIYDTKEVRTVCFHHDMIPRISPHPRRKPVEPVRPVPKGVRWVVERTHSWLNRFRRLFVRYDKSTDNYLAFVKFAAANITFSRLGVSG